jgi:WD40 repeat protein
MNRGLPSALVAAVGLGTLLAAVHADVQPWKPAGISSPRFESHPAFDPRTGEFYFVRSSPQFTGWRILVSRCTETGWSPPAPPAFAGDGVEADPFLTADDRTLYFISTRSLDGVKRGDLDIWRVDRDTAGIWGAPTHLPEPINSSAAEWFPRPAADGWLYFGSSRPGGLGATDIWRGRADAGGKWTVENLGAGVNTAGDEYEPLPAPDGSRMIIMADGSLYETRPTATGWGPRTRLGSEVNQNGTEIGALFSPSGRSLLFARDTKGPDSGEFFVWYEHGPEAWPPECTPRADDG